MFKLFLLVFIIFHIITTFAHNHSINIEADKLSYDRRNYLIIAEGNVLIKKKRCQVIADKIIFDKKRQYLYIVGDLIIKSRKQTYYFGTKAFFSTGTTKGIITKFQTRFFKKELFIAELIRIKKSRNIIIKNFIFSTCKICADNSILYSPLWQIKLKRVIINHQKNRADFKTNKIELKGIPVLYLPYITIPNVNIIKMLGSFMPRFNKSYNMELQISIPHYFSISPYINFSYIHTISNKKKSIFNIDIEYSTKHGPYRWTTCFFSKSNNPNYSLYLHTNALLNINDRYYVNYKIQRLVNKGKTFWNNHITHHIILDNYLSIINKRKDMLLTVENFTFQAFEKRKKYHNYILPSITNVSKFSLFLKSRSIFFNHLFYIKTKKRDHRIKSTVKLELFCCIKLFNGQIFNLHPSVMYNHMYKINSKKDVVTDQITKKFYVEWQWPLIRVTNKDSVIIEPSINFRYNKKIVRNILNNQKYFSIRRTLNTLLSNLSMRKNILNNQSHIYWDIKYNYYSNNTMCGVSLGQKIKLNVKKIPIINSHLISYTWNNQKYLLKSDIIGKFYIKYNTNLSIINKLYFSFNRLQFIKNEMDFYFIHKKSKIKLSHTHFSRRYHSLQDLYNQEMIFELRKNINNLWCIGTIIKKHLGPNITLKNVKSNQWISHEIGFFYKGDCFKFHCGIKKDYLKLCQQSQSSIISYFSIEPIFN